MKPVLFYHRRRAHDLVLGLARSYQNLSEDTMYLTASGLHVGALIAIAGTVPSSPCEVKDPRYHHFLDFTMAHLLGAPHAPPGLIPLSQIHEHRFVSGPKTILVHIAVEVLKSRQRLQRRLRKLAYASPTL